MTNYLVAFAIFLCLSRITIEAVPTDKLIQNGFHLKILHNNDMHARFEQVSRTSGNCSPNDARRNNCYGGFARIAHLVRKYRKECESNGYSFLYLNAGDTYTGTPWFTIYKHEIASRFVKLLAPDAISLGNHEFDNGVEGLIPFVQNVNTTVLAANLNFSKVPELKNSKSLKPFTILTLNNTKVGVIGYLTPVTKLISAIEGVEFSPEIESINDAAKKLKEEGVNIIIALGHSGYIKDQEIAKECPDVDIVVGAHSHSFLFDGKAPPKNQPEIIEGPYPTVVTQKSGKRVPVVQAYAYTKYIGSIDVVFDEGGNIIEFSGTPILLDSSIPQEPDVLELLEEYRPKIVELETAVVGRTAVQLDASKCRSEECNIGNLITESMIDFRAKFLSHLNMSKYWTDAAIALYHGGGIRSSIDKSSGGNITMRDVLTTLPFGNKMLLIEVHGKTIRNALEHSAKLYKTDSSGGFLQMHGLKVEYDMKKSVGNRVISAEVLCSECDIPSFTPLNNTKLYKLITCDFLYEGGDGHVFKESNVRNPVELPELLSDMFNRLLETRQLVYPGIDDRIKISSATSILVSLWTFFAVLALGRLL